MRNREIDQSAEHTLITKSYCCICNELIETNRVMVLLSEAIPDPLTANKNWTSMVIFMPGTFCYSKTYRACPKHEPSELLRFVAKNEKIKL